MQKLCVLVCAVLAVCAAVAAAADGRLEVTVHSGWSFVDVEKEDPFCIACEFPFFTNTTTVDSSPLFGVKAGYFLNDHSEVEGRFAVAPNHNVVTDNSFVCPPGRICPLGDLYYPFFHSERNMVAYEYGGSFVYNITKSNVRPFLTFGVGGVSSDVDLDTRHDFAFQFGGGAKFYFKNTGVRFEVIDQVIPDYFLTGETQHDLQIQYGFLLRL